MGVLCSNLCPQERNTVVANYYFHIWKMPDNNIGSTQVSESFQNGELPTRSNEDIRKRYIFDTHASWKGGFGKVVKARLKRDKNQMSVVKIIKKADQITDFNAIKEAELLRKLDHPNIVKFREVYEDNTSFYIVLEYLKGGDLLNYLKPKEKLQECEAIDFIWQILLATNYLHVQRIVHGDLKLENFVLVSSSKRWIKMIDFGLSDILKKRDHLSVFSGSRYYIAPEVLEGNYNEKRDLWSIGVILYQFAVGSLPYYSEEEDELFDLISQGKYDLEALKQSGYSDEGVNLCIELMNLLPEDRPSARQALQNKWFDSKRLEVNKEGESLLNKEEILTLKAHTSSSSFKKEVLSIAAQLFDDESQTERTSKIFLMADSDFSGSISKPELKTIFIKTGVKVVELEIDNMINYLHIKEKNSITYLELSAGMLMKDLLVDDHKLEIIFKSLDANNDNEICISDLNICFSRFGRCLPLNKIQYMISEIDINNDRKINLEEFIEGMRR